MQRHGVEDLQIVKTEVVLFAEDVAHERFDTRPFSLGGDMAEWRILVLETADYRLVVQMRGTQQKPSYFWHVGEKVLAVVLTDSLDGPRYAALDELSGGVWLSDNLVVGGADALKAAFGGRCNCYVFHRLSHR